jgi:hypothetical protein
MNMNRLFWPLCHTNRPLYTHLREDHELTHDIRLELNTIKAMQVELMRFHNIEKLSRPEDLAYEHASYTPAMSAANDLLVGKFNVFNPFHINPTPRRQPHLGHQGHPLPFQATLMQNAPGVMPQQAPAVVYAPAPQQRYGGIPQHAWGGGSPVRST